MAAPNKWSHCKYCGARLKRDPVGQYCPTKNCQWQHGLPLSEDTKRKLYKHWSDDPKNQGIA